MRTDEMEFMIKMMARVFFQQGDLEDYLQSWLDDDEMEKFIAILEKIDPD